MGRGTQDGWGNDSVSALLAAESCLDKEDDGGLVTPEPGRVTADSKRELPSLRTWLDVALKGRSLAESERFEAQTNPEQV